MCDSATSRWHLVLSYLLLSSLWLSLSLAKESLILDNSVLSSSKKLSLGFLGSTVVLNPSKHPIRLSHITAASEVFSYASVHNHSVIASVANAISFPVDHAQEAVEFQLSPSGSGCVGSL